MNYKKVKLGDAGNIPQSMWSTDDNILCDNSKTLRENLAEKFDDAILEGNLLKLYSNGILKKTLTLPEGTTEVEKFGDIVISKTSSTIRKGETDTVTVKLNSAPTNDEIITITSDSTDVTLT